MGCPEAGSGVLGFSPDRLCPGSRPNFHDSRVRFPVQADRNQTSQTRALRSLMGRRGLFAGSSERSPAGVLGLASGSASWVLAVRGQVATGGRAAGMVSRVASSRAFMGIIGAGSSHTGGANSFTPTVRFRCWYHVPVVRPLDAIATRLEKPGEDCTRLQANPSRSLPCTGTHRRRNACLGATGHLESSCRNCRSSGGARQSAVGGLTSPSRPRRRSSPSEVAHSTVRPERCHW